MRKFKLVSWIVAVLYFSKSSEGFRISQLYSAVDALGNSCPTSDSCERRWLIDNDSVPEATANDYTCACDEQCTEYDDCCIDAPRRRSGKNQMQCHEVKDLGGIYMMDSCPSEYNRSEIVRQLCGLINLGYQSDPLAAKPMTEASSGITYKNVYCFSCNKDFRTRQEVERSSGSFNSWSLKWDCSHKPQFTDSEEISDDLLMYTLLHNMHYYWHEFVDHDINLGQRLYKGCDLKPALRSRFQDKVRRCIPNLVSDCPASWKDENVRSMCKSYAGPRFDLQAEGRGYRNVHCAYCNGANVTQLSCLPLKRVDTFQYSGNSSFAQIEEVKEKMRQCVVEKDRDNRYCPQ